MSYYNINLTYYQNHYAEGQLSEFDKKIESAKSTISVLQGEVENLKHKGEFAKLKFELKKVSTPTILTVCRTNSVIELIC